MRPGQWKCAACLRLCTKPAEWEQRFAGKDKYQPICGRCVAKRQRTIANSFLGWALIDMRPITKETTP